MGHGIDAKSSGQRSGFGTRKVHVRVGEQLREMWREVRGVGQDGRGREAGAAELMAAAEAERKTLALPAILSPVQFPGRHLPKPTPVNLRRFAETPVVRRAINVIKDRIAAMDWQVAQYCFLKPTVAAVSIRRGRSSRRERCSAVG